MMKQLAVILLSTFIFFSCAQPPNGAGSADADQSNQAEVLIPDTSWTTKVEKTNAEWKKILTSAQYNITREQGTEAPFSSKLNDIHDTGIFYCISCKNPVFSSTTKFNSGTGWPSFYAPYSTKSVSVSMDNSAGMERDEISCQRCGAHLGHVFNDGPKPTGLRYCMDGVAMQFQKEDLNAKIAKATFACGCFWCEEAIFESVKGVRQAVSGYAGGQTQNPTYEEVGGETTGHAETVEVYYDSTVVTYPQLLRVYFASGDLTQVNGQGPDHGSSYRSIIFYRNDTEKKEIDDYMAELTISGKYSKPLSVEVTPYTKFWKAENYHQDYVEHHPEVPYVQNESIPRLKRAQKEVADLIKPEKMRK
ncbi:MAG: peptide-methionine (R)-S-oxide reductase MsrB [Ferruginibacter sp.]